MKYKKYPSYKDSGVEWLGEIPSEWGIKKLKYISSIQTGSTPLTSNDSYFSDEIGIPWIKPDELNNLVPIKTSKKFLTEKGKNVSRIIKKDSVLVCGIGTIGKFGIAGVDLTTNQQINSVTFNNKLNFNYGKFLIASSQQEMDKFSNGNVVKILNTESQKNIDYPFPSFEEQQQIANFLDKATAKIDTLIEKQTKQIELLKEKRQAVISHAVTKGINPNVPMKDSGVEWFGEIPEHWDTSRIKFNAKIKGRIGFRGYTKDDLVDKTEGALVIGASEMNNNAEIILDSPQYISWYKYYESPEIILKKDDILFVQRGSTVGKVAHINYDIEEATINPSLVVIKEIKINECFLKYYLMSNIIKSTVKVQTSSTAIPMISQEQIGNYVLSYPEDKTEQQQIVNYLDDKTSKIDTLIEKSKKLIELLKEKRTALISACVTGKIDVRGNI